MDLLYLTIGFGVGVLIGIISIFTTIERRRWKFQAGSLPTRRDSVIPRTSAVKAPKP